MSPEVIAALLGVLVGVLGERIARMIGRLSCEVSGWELKFWGERDGMGSFDILEPEEAKKYATQVEYHLSIDFFNGREIPTGLRDIAVELDLDDGRRIKDRPYDLATGRPRPVSGEYYDTLDVLNLPPRQYVHVELKGGFGREGATVLASGQGVHKVEFVGERPRRPVLGILGRKTYREVITKHPVSAIHLTT